MNDVESDSSDAMIEALSYFRHPERAQRLNCAQSILKVFQEECDITDEDIQTFAGYGHGSSPEGQCGALYAAKWCLTKLGMPTDGIEEYFYEEAGSMYCREIRKKRQWPCTECVKNAAGYVAKCCDKKRKKEKNDD
jgi:hypothetical protein